MGRSSAPPTFDCRDCGMQCSAESSPLRPTAVRDEDRIEARYCTVCWLYRRVAELEERMESLTDDFGKWRRGKR